METNVNYTVVGAFVLLLITAIIISTLWLSSGLSSQSYSTYAIYMPESVDGLNIDSPVEFNGVNVGSVKSIALDKNNPHLVDLLLNIKSGTLITQGTTATLATRGVTGVAFISLRDKSTDRTPLTALPNQAYPIIKTAPSLFLRLDTAITKLNDNLSNVSHSIQKLLDKDNLDNIKKMLKDMEVVTKTLSGNSQKLNLIFKNTFHATETLVPTLQNISNQTLPTTNQLLNNLNQLSSEVKENPALLLRGSQSLPLGPGER